MLHVPLHVLWELNMLFAKPVILYISGVGILMKNLLLRDILYPAWVMRVILHLEVKHSLKLFNKGERLNCGRNSLILVSETAVMRKFILVTFCISYSIFLRAQDPHFSQFFSSPLTLNPAFTGKFDGNVRIAGNYRDQWPTINQAYRTGTVSVDFPIMKKSIDYRDTWGIGIMGYSDKSAAGAVSFDYVSLSTAFHKGLDEDGYK